jgi:glycerophosphoryl diester phosphodiesterase
MPPVIRAKDRYPGPLIVLLSMPLKNMRPSIILIHHMHLRQLGLSVILFLLIACQRNKDVPVLEIKWDLFDSTAARPLGNREIRALEGVYAIEAGAEDFGPVAAAKWSYTVEGKDTTAQLSFLCGKDGAYFICEAKQLDSVILLRGYWRKMENSETGTVRLTIAANGAAQSSDSSRKKALAISGTWGDDEEQPAKSIQLNRQRPLYDIKPFEIVAHRGGGRNTDFLPSSENSIELILRAARFGATGVEIDVQFTKDGIPVLYHDDRINDRLTKKTGIHGKLNEYTLAELSSSVKLTKGEKIPTLEDALRAIVHQTPLHYIWLDAKEKEGLEKIRALQEKFTKEAAAIGRQLEITIGIHNDDVYKNFLLLPDYKQIPTTCELDPEKSAAINARIWAPMWTKGLQKEEVSAIHAQGRRAFVWTVDKTEKMQEFLNEGNYDGIVSNYPSQVAYYYYTRQ